jgi:S1-C subfamily serine protease
MLSGIIIMEKPTNPTSLIYRQNVLLLLLFTIPLILVACNASAVPKQDQPPAEAFDSFIEADAFLANELNTIDVVNEFGPSVVAINVTIQGEPMQPFANVPTDQIPPQFRDLLPFLEEEVPTQQSAGSGFLIDAKGSGTSYLVTNFHVVQGSLEPGTTNLLEDATITAVFPGLSEDPVPVKVVGANPSFDLALLSGLNPSNSFPDVIPLTIADSDAVQVGQKVIAIGNPFGLEFTVTSGIVSAIGRFVTSVGQINIPMIQTDPAINPGNSGGPLLNSRGELVGINTAIFNPEGRSFAGLGFAVPSNLLIEALANLELGGLSDIRATRPTLGSSLRTVSLLPGSIRELLELPDEGVVVIDVLPGGPADKAGLRGSQRTVEVGAFEFPAGGDVITAVNGEALMNAEQLNLLITYEGEAGDLLEFAVLRDGREINLTVTLEILE